jgi:hypothetical protein
MTTPKTPYEQGREAAKSGKGMPSEFALRRNQHKRIMWLLGNRDGRAELKAGTGKEER